MAAKQPQPPLTVKDVLDAPAPDGLVTVTIERGTYTDVVDGVTVSYGPGSVIKVTAEDARTLKFRGFVRADDYQAPAEVQDGTLKITTGDGPSVTSIGVVTA